MVRRFTITAFALLYAAAVFASSAEKAADWIRRQTPTQGYASSSTPTVGVGKIEKSDTRVSQTKMNETAFVVESPHNAVTILLHSERHLPASPFEYRSAASLLRQAPRAPPSLV